MRPVTYASLAVFAAVIVGAVATGPFMSNVEHPPYSVERVDGSIELRAYPPMTVATIDVTGSRAATIQKGFRTLADYIFGANEEANKIEMTAPVMQGRGSIRTSKRDDWVVRFIMPRSWSKESLPKPRDPRVTLETMPAASYAVIRFSGFWRDALLQRKAEELEAYVERHALVRRSEPIYAFYNPPWTLPFFRRNEVMIEIAGS